MGKVEKITEEVIENEQEVKELLSKQSIEDLYEFFLAKDSTLTEEEFNDEVYDILEYYLKNISKEIKKLEENETKQIVGGKSDIIKKSLSASLCLLTLTSGINASASPTSVNPSSQKAVSVWNNKKQEKSVTFGEKIKAWVKKNKKALIITGSVTAAVIAGIIITVVVYKNKKNVKQPKDNINVPINQRPAEQSNNNSEKSTAEKLLAASERRTGNETGKESPATASTVRGRVEAQEAAQKEREAEIQRQLEATFKACEGYENAVARNVERTKKSADEARSKAVGRDDADVVANLKKVNEIMKEANEAAQRAKKALNAAKEAKDLKALEAAEAEIKAARNSAATAGVSVASISKQLNARLNGVAVDDIAASKNPPNPLGRSRNASVPGSRPDAGFRPKTVDELTQDAGNSIPNGIVGDGVAAAEKRGGGAVFPTDRCTNEQNNTLYNMGIFSAEQNFYTEFLDAKKNIEDHSETFKNRMSTVKKYYENGKSTDGLFDYVNDSLKLLSGDLEDMKKLQNRTERNYLSDIDEEIRKELANKIEDISKKVEESEKSLNEVFGKEIKKIENWGTMISELITNGRYLALRLIGNPEGE